MESIDGLTESASHDRLVDTINQNSTFTYDYCRCFEAKTHLSSLLERVAQGEEIIITRHGKPLARLVPVNVADRSQIDHAISKLKGLRKNCTLDGVPGREFRDRSRRWQGWYLIAQLQLLGVSKMRHPTFAMRYWSGM